MSATAENKQQKIMWSLDVYPDEYWSYYGEEGPPKPKLVILKNGDLAEIEPDYNGFTLRVYDKLPLNRTFAILAIKAGLVLSTRTYHPFGSSPIELADDTAVIPDILDLPESSGRGWWPT